MSGTEFKTASVTMRSESDNEQVDFNLNEAEIKESFFDSIYHTMKEEGEIDNPVSIAEQAKMMVEALDFDISEDLPEVESIERDVFSPEMGHGTVSSGFSVEQKATVVITRKAGSTVNIDNGLIDQAASEYIASMDRAITVEYDDDSSPKASVQQNTAPPPATSTPSSTPSSSAFRMRR